VLDLYLFVQISIYEDAAAMLAYNDLLALANFALALRWDYIEAAAAGVA
jgi:hypothetical protein